MTTADALRVSDSMEQLVTAMGIQDPQLKKIVLDQFIEEASNGMGHGLSVDEIVLANEMMIKKGFPPAWAMETAIREEAKARGLI